MLHLYAFLFVGMFCLFKIIKNYGQHRQQACTSWKLKVAQLAGNWKRL